MKNKAFQQIDLLKKGVAHFDALRYDPDLPVNEVIRREKVSRNMQRLWKDPVYRANALEKQRGLGFRSYPNSN